MAAVRVVNKRVFLSTCLLVPSLVRFTFYTPVKMLLPRVAASGDIREFFSSVDFGTHYYAIEYKENNNK